MAGQDTGRRSPDNYAERYGRFIGRGLRGPSIDEASTYIKDAQAVHVPYWPTGWDKVLDKVEKPAWEFRVALWVNEWVRVRVHLHP